MKEIKKSKILKEYNRRKFWKNYGIAIHLFGMPGLFGASILLLTVTVNEFFCLLIFPCIILWILQWFNMPSLPGDGSYKAFEKMYLEIEYQKREKRNYKWIG